MTKLSSLLRNGALGSNWRQAKAVRPQSRLAQHCSWARTFASCRKGAAAVEFALVVPSFVLILAGLLEFGVFFWNKHSLEFATEETGRVVMTKSTVSNDAVSADLKSRLPGMDPDKLTATVSQETVGATTFVTINVAFTYDYLILGGMLGFEPTTIESKTRVPLHATQ